MNSYKAAYLSYMDQKGIKYRDLDDIAVRVSYSGDNLKTIPIIVFFNKNGENVVQFACWEIANFKDDKFNAGLIACNSLNAKFRWVKFFLDSDQDVRVQADAVVDMDTVGAECSEIVARMVGIIDEAYPEIMTAIWSKPN